MASSAVGGSCCGLSLSLCLRAAHTIAAGGLISEGFSHLALVLVKQHRTGLDLFINY